MNLNEIDVEIVHSMSILPPTPAPLRSTARNLSHYVLGPR